MRKKNPRANKQQSAQQKDKPKLPSTHVIGVVNNKPNCPNHGKKSPGYTQQQDDKDGYPRNWYSPPKNSEPWKKRLLKWTHEYSTLVNIVIAAAALYVIWSQNWIYNEQTKLMDRQNNEAKITRETENRAYVGIKEIKMVTVENTTGTIVLGFTNTGNTPARGVARTRMCLGDRNSLPFNGTKIQTPWPCPDAKPKQLVFLPSVIIDYDVTDIPIFFGAKPPPLSPAKTVGLPPAPLPADRTAMYVFGDIRYWDIFDSEHVTEFCYYLTHERPKAFYICPANNSFN